MLAAPSRRSPLGVAAFALAALAPLCAVATYLAMNGGERWVINILLIVDFCVALGLLALIAWRIARLVLARRARSAGSRLHLRMVRMFTLVAIAPALLLGFFASVTVTVGLDDWFNRRVSNVVHNSVALALGYIEEKQRETTRSALRIANEIASAPASTDLRARLWVAVKEPEGARSFIIDGAGAALAQGPESYLYQYSPPTPEQIEAARAQGVSVYRGREGEIVALAPLAGAPDLLIHISRPVEAEALRKLDETRSAVQEYGYFQQRRLDMQLVFAGIYMGFASLVVLAAIWFGIWFADRLSRPIGRLAGAAGRIAQGDLSARVIEERGDDEIALLSRVFNRMGEEVKNQRDELVSVNEQIDQRRRFIEAVLSGVSAGVIGVNDAGRVYLANNSAGALLGMAPEDLQGAKINRIAPEIEPVLRAAARAATGVAEGRASLIRAQMEVELLVRAAAQRGEEGEEGFVVTFDDMTELISAQRMAAWGDVARRVAHEIKNPLTPIQLSAERLKRKFSRQIDTDLRVFENCTETIVRQVGDIRRMVDEFSNFARMPEPKLAREDLAAIMREAAMLRAEAHPDIAFDLSALPEALPCKCDRGLMSQAFTNLFKNAAEAVQARLEEGADMRPGKVRAALEISDESIIATVSDNGVGLPRLDRRRLTEPYVTTRPKGTGLGLAIVKRVAEQHGGRLTLEDAPTETEDAPPDTPPGALARITLPLALLPGAAPEQAETQTI